MGQVYTASFTAATVTTARDLFELTAPADAVVRILSCRLGQLLDAGNAEAEMVAVEIERYTGADGTGGTTPTPQPHQVGFNAAGSVVRADVTLGATRTELLADVFNVQAGWLYQPIPEEMIYVSASDKIAIAITAPNDELTMHCSLTFEELGG